MLRLLCLVAAATTCVDARPLDALLDAFLGDLYERVRAEDEAAALLDRMQGDQPSDNHIANMLLQNDTSNKSSSSALSDVDYLRTLRNRTKDNWIQALKENILRQIGRSNTTTIKTQDSLTSALNMTSIIPALFNTTSSEDDQITEKIRSYYPSCDIPPSLEQDSWKDDNIMNLYFNFDYGVDEKGLNVATATLRLYRIPSQNSSKDLAPKASDCSNSSSSTEEEKFLRVSIYWYTRAVKQKKKVKRKLCDSKVISENSRWVELSIKPAIRAWTKGRNLGLAVLVEDQELNVLKADKLFKGISCMVGASTPKPIPTIIIDAARQSNELDRINSLLGRNATSPLSGDLPLLPSIDICTLEFPENYSAGAPISELRTNACNLRRAHEQNLLVEERERLERLAALPGVLATPPRHIRHQRQHHKATGEAVTPFDPRSKIVNKKVLSQEEVQALRLNISRINR